MPFGPLIHDARVVRGLKRRQVADLVGVTEAQYGRYETGSSLPSDQVLSRLISVLELDSAQATALWIEARRRRRGLRTDASEVEKIVRDRIAALRARDPAAADDVVREIVELTERRLNEAKTRR